MMRRINLIRALNKRVKESWMSKYINSIQMLSIFRMSKSAKQNWFENEDGM